MADPDLALWLFNRFGGGELLTDWAEATLADRAYWEREADMVRQAAATLDASPVLVVAVAAAPNAPRPTRPGPSYGWRAAVTPEDRDWDDS
jgi:hypothetical protein